VCFARSKDLGGNILFYFYNRKESRRSISPKHDKAPYEAGRVLNIQAGCHRGQTCVRDHYRRKTMIHFDGIRTEEETEIRCASPSTTVGNFVGNFIATAF